MQNHAIHKPLTQDELIQGCLKNNRIIQKKLYDQYRVAMFSLAYRMVNDWDLAHDVLQDAFIDVFKSIHQFRGESTLGSWIRTIVVRAGISKIKERNRLTFENLPSMETTVRFDEDFKGEQLDKAIRSLPTATRSVFVLIEVEGYKHKEVAEMLNISDGTSKSQLNYAKQLLKKKLKEFKNVNE
ncbi:MAG: RNA polymerase sigma factor [Prolixibacteraceae bacterium]